MSEATGQRMSKVRNRVTVSPETVAKGEKLAKKTAARKRVQKKTPPAPVSVHYQRPKDFSRKLWSEGLKLARNQPKRLIPLSDDELLIVNREGLGVPGKPKARRRTAKGTAKKTAKKA